MFVTTDIAARDPPHRHLISSNIDRLTDLHRTVDDTVQDRLADRLQLVGSWRKEIVRPSQSVDRWRNITRHSAVFPSLTHSTRPHHTSTWSIPSPWLRCVLGYCRSVDQRPDTHGCGRVIPLWSSRTCCRPADVQSVMPGDRLSATEHDLSRSRHRDLL